MKINVETHESAEEVPVRFDGRFTKGDERASKAGKKGGRAPKQNGSKTGATYKFAGFVIKWQKTRSMWVAKRDEVTLYARSIREIKDDIRNEAYKQYKEQ